MGLTEVQIKFKYEFTLILHSLINSNPGSLD